MVIKKNKLWSQIKPGLSSSVTFNGYITLDKLLNLSKPSFSLWELIVLDCSMNATLWALQEWEIISLLLSRTNYRKEIMEIPFWGDKLKMGSI